MKIWKVTPATFLLLLGYFSLASAGNKNWLGSSGNNWSNPSNWSPAGVPGPSDSAIFGSSNIPCVIDISTSVQSIQINSGFTQAITLLGGQYLTVNSSFTMNNSSFTMANPSSMTVLGDFKVFGGTFSVGKNEIALTGTWQKSNAVNWLPGNSTITLMGFTQYINDNTTFYALRAVTPGATLYFASYSTQTVVSMIDFEYVTLKPQGTYPWNLNFIGSSQTVKGVKVSSSNASGGNTINPDGLSVDLGGNVNWNFQDSGMRFWRSAAGGYWSNTANWASTCGGMSGTTLPNSSHTVVFDSACGGSGYVDIDTTVAVGTVTIRNYFSNIYANSSSITINKSFYQESGYFNLNYATVVINGNMARSGGMFNAGQSVVKLAGPKNVVTGNFDFYILKILSPGSSVYFSVGSSVTINSGFECRYSTLRSTQDASNWKLIYSGSSLTVVGSYIQDSDASGGATLVPDFWSVDGGNNLNWEFPLFNPSQIEINGVDNGFKNGDVQWGDMDNDGDLDIVVMGLDSGGYTQMKIFLNNGNGTFNPSSYNIDATVNNCLAYGRMALGDYNRDGKLDIFVLGSDRSSNKRIRVYRNNGSMSFGPLMEIETDTNRGLTEGDIELGDYDNDGDLDVLVMGLDGQAYTQMRIYRNNGNGTFSSYQNVAGEGNGYSHGGVAFGDFDRDGDLDILVSGYYGTYSQLKVFKNYGDGTFDPTPIEVDGTNGGLKNGDSAWGDFDNDGDLDILVSGVDSSFYKQLRVYKNLGNGSFDPIEIDVSGWSNGLDYGSASWGDFNNDGLLDILVSGYNSNGNQLRIYKNNGSGGFIYTPLEIDGLGGGLMYSRAAFGDYDADGDLDVVAMGQSSNSKPQLRVYNSIASSKMVNTAPTPPGNLMGSFTFVEYGVSEARFKWDGAVDNGPGATPQNGLYYELQVATSSDLSNPIIQSYSHQKPSFGNYLRPPKIFDGNSKFGVILKSSTPFDNSTGLITDSTYYFRVKTVDAGLKASTFSAVGIFNTGVAPGPVNDLSAQPGTQAGSVKLNWMSPGDDSFRGTLNQAEYVIQGTTDAFFAGWSPSAAQPDHVKRITISTNAVTPYSMHQKTLSGLVPEATYYFRIWTRDDYSLWSAISNGATTFAQVQASPQFLNAWPVYVSSLTVSWSSMVSQTGYVLEASTDIAFLFNLKTTTNADPYISSLTVASLSPNTSYYLRVGSLWLDGTTNYSSVIEENTLAQNPSNFQFPGIFQSSITLSWDGNGNPSGTLYRVDIASVSNFSNVMNSSWTKNLYCEFPGLFVWTTYFFQIQSINYESVASSFVYFGSTRTLAIGPPLSLYFFDAQETSLSLNWGWPTPSPSSFTVQISSSPNFDTSFSSTSVAASQSFTSLLINTTYYGRIKSHLNGSESGWLVANPTATKAGMPGVISSTWVSVNVTSITFAWGNGPNPPGTRFVAEMSPNIGFASDILSLVTTQSSGTISGLNPGTTYYARVKALNHQGLPSSFRTMGSTQTITSSLPTGLKFIASSTYSLTASWNISSPPADKYTLELGTSSDFNGTNESTVTVLSTFTFAGLGVNEMFFSRVNAILGPSTSAWVMGASTATLTEMPLGVSSTWTAVFFTSFTANWDQGANPSYTIYELNISTDMTFLNDVHSATVTASSCSMSGLIPGQIYWGRVRSINLTGVESSFSYLGSTQTLSVNFPNNLHFISVSSTAITAQWDAAVPPADSYTLRMSPSLDFSAGVLKVNGAGTSLGFTGLTPNTSYWFQVLSVIGGSSSTWSGSISTPTLATAPDFAANSFPEVGMSSITVAWQRGDNPSGSLFNVEISSFDNYTSVFSSITMNQSSQFTGLAIGTSYYARVQAINHGGEAGPFLILGGTKTLPVTSPAGFWFTIASTTYLTGNWGASSPPGDGYNFELALTPGFDSGVVSTTVVTLNGTIDTLSPNTTYYGHVRSYLNGSTSPWTTSQTTATLAEVPAVPGNCWLMVEKTSATLAWLHNGNPSYTTYLSEISPDPSFISNVLPMHVADSSVTFQGLMADTTYYGRVRAINHRGVKSDPVVLGSTQTKIANPGTVLTPYFSFVGLDILNVNWVSIPGANFVAALSTDVNFTTTVSSTIVGLNNRNFTALLPDTSYFFKVKVATEPDGNYSLVIATKTQSQAAVGNFALYFNRNYAQVVNLPHMASFDMNSFESRTVEFWFRRTTSTFVTDEFLISKDNSAGTTGWGVFLKDYPRRIRFQLFGGGGLTSSGTITDMNWHHVALVRDSFGNTNLYLDGQWDCSGVTGGAVTNTYKVKFGNSDARNKSFEGVIDEVRIWNYQRTVSEIMAQRFQHFISYQAGLVGYWDMDEGTGQSVGDKSGGTSHGYRGTTASPEASVDPQWVNDPIPGFGAPPESTPPTVKILMPLSGSTHTKTGLVAISGTAQDNQALSDVKIAVKRLSDGKFWRFFTAPAVGYWEYGESYYYAGANMNWMVSVGDVVWSTGATYSVYAKAQDTNFNVGVDTVTFLIDVSTDVVPPTVGVTFPVQASTYTPSQLALVNGTAADNEVVVNVGVRIKRSADNKYWNKMNLMWQTDEFINLANGQINWDLAVPISAWEQIQSTYALTAMVLDMANNSSSGTVVFSVNTSTATGSDNISPTVFINHPATGSVHSPSALISLNGTASDNINLSEVAVMIKDLDLTKYWDGALFNGASVMWFYLANPGNWSFSSIPQDKWAGGHRYLLSARAKDSIGNVGYHSVEFEVSTNSVTDTILPSIFINTPISGGVYSPNTVAISGTASDNMGLAKVWVKIKRLDSGMYYDNAGFNSAASVVLPAAGLTNWSFYIPAGAYQNANYLLVAIASDTSGLTQTSSVTFTVSGATVSADVTAPTLKVQFPENLTIFTSADIGQLTQIYGTAADDVGVVEVNFSVKDDNNMYWDGAGWGTYLEFWRPIAGNMETWQGYMPLNAWKNGNFQITVRARDQANHLVYDSVNFSISGSSATGAADSLPPNNFIDSPLNNSVQGPNMFAHLTGHADDPFGVAEVKLSLLSVNSAKYWTGSGFNADTEFNIFPANSYSDSTNVDWYYDLPFTAYSNGTYLLKVRAKDFSNYEKISYSSFSVIGAGQGAGDLTPPEVAIIHPANPSPFTYDASTMTTIWGTASDNVALQEILVRIINNSSGKYWDGSGWNDAEIWLMAEGLNPWYFRSSTGTWADGEYNLTVKARDTVGNEKVDSKVISISGVGTGGVPPTVAITYPSNDATYLSANMAAISGTASGDATYVYLRIRDVNLMMDWDPVTKTWLAGTYSFQAALAGGVWVSSGSQLPFWPQGRFKVIAEAENSLLLVSNADAKEFNVDAGIQGTSDFTPPAAITDLKTYPGSTVGSVRLTWTASGDDGKVGIAQGYIIKYRSGAPITTEADWIAANDIAFSPINLMSPAPSSPGTMETFYVFNLNPGVGYFWGIKVRDEANNKSVISNSPMATAYSGNMTASADGEGTASIAPVTFAERTMVTSTITFTVGAGGMTSGGRIDVKIPDGWMFPQTWGPASSGYVYAYSDNPTVSLSLSYSGQVVSVSVVTGPMNQGDKIYIIYLAEADCGVRSGVQFKVMSRGGSFGVLTEIASHPTVSITKGPASWLGFENPEKFVSLNQATPIVIKGQNSCGGEAQVSSNIAVNASAVIWDTNLGQWINDPLGNLSLTSDMASSGKTKSTTVLTGKSSATVYYLLTSTANRGQNRVKISYTDLRTGSYTSENSLNIVPLNQGTGISDLSVDTGQMGGNLTQVTITPDGDGVNDMAFINFTLGDPNISWRIQISSDNFSTIIRDEWGWGSPARRAWDGRTNSAMNEVVPPGTYRIKVIAAGIENTSLQVIVQAVELKGRVLNSTTSLPVPDAYVNVYGPIIRNGRTDAQGNFSLVGLPTGAYILRIDKEGYSSYQADVNMTGTTKLLGDISLKPFSKLVFNATRVDSAQEVWGNLKAIGGGEDIRCSVHFAAGKTAPDSGAASTSLPELFLKPSISYTITTEIGGYPTQTLTNKTFAEGEVYNWTLTLNPKGGISGVLRLGNGILNQAGFPVFLAAGLDNNSDGIFDSGVPSGSIQVFMPPFESQTSYSFRGMDDGKYLVTMTAPGFSPTQGQAVIAAGVGATLDLILTQSGSLNVTLQFTGDTTFLNQGSSTFPVTVRIQSDGGFSAALSSGVVKTANSTSGLFRFTGVPNGTYTIYVDKIEGFGLVPPGPKTAAVVAGGGATTLQLARLTGSIMGTVSLAQGSSVSDLRFLLTNGAMTVSTPTIFANPFEFRNLDSGWYSLSVLDNQIGASQMKQVFVANGAATSVQFDLASQTFFSISGTVRSIAAPPYHNLTSIVDVSSPTWIYDANGNLQSINALRIEGYLVNQDNSVDPLPTTPGSRLNTAKIKFGFVDVTSGTYQINGLKQGVPYKFRLNTDIDGDGQPDIPMEEKLISLSASQVNVDFTIRSGGSIIGTISAPVADNGYALTIKLTDVDLKVVVRTLAVALVGSSASYSFTNLRVGRYLVQVADNNSPAKYTAKSVFVNLDTDSGSKSADVTLVQGAVIQGKLADAAGQLITSQNSSYKLPSGFTIKLLAQGHSIEATGPSADGTFSADVIPNLDYSIIIKPPLDQGAGMEGKGFLSVTLQGKAGIGEVFDWGTVILEPGVKVTGYVKDAQGLGKDHVPLYAYQSLSRNLEPLKVFTDVQGQFSLDDLDSRVRFYDFIANKTGQADSLPSWSEASKTMVDITKPEQIQNLNLVVTPLLGALKGNVVSSIGAELKAGFGQKAGWPGVSILLTREGDRKLLEFISESDGSFNISLDNANYDVEFLAEGHKVYTVKVNINNEHLDLSNITLQVGVSLSGSLRNADGSLPTQAQVARVLAIDTSRRIFRANLTLESVTASVDRYSFSGLTPGIHTILAVDTQGRPRVLRINFDVPDQNTTLDLTFLVSEPRLVASFIQKLPDGVEAIFGCNQSFRNNPDDLDGNGISDDNEFEDFVSVTKGNGTLEFQSVDADRRKASYLYTMVNEAQNSYLQISALFRTEEIDPKTGANFIANGTFTHPFGLASQQEDVVTNLGGEFVLPGGSGLNLPENWSNDSDLDGILVKFQAADALDTFAGAGPMSGMGARALAQKLGPAYYPASMYKAIRALDSVPDVNPFSSFYDIFLPASVSRVFSNKPTLTLTYDESVTDPSTLNIYYFNEAQGVYTIENNDRRIDTVNRKISVSIGHASVFTVLASSASIIRGSSYSSGEVDVFNFPNPFNMDLKTVTLQHPGSNSASQQIRGTMIKVSLPPNISGSIEIDIYNLSGEKVRKLSSVAPAGGSHYYIEWDGTNDHGREVASGIYIGRLKVDGASEKFFKMAVVK